MGKTHIPKPNLNEVAEKLERRLSSIESEWVKDPKFTGMMVRPNDVAIGCTHNFWVFFCTPVYVGLAVVAFVFNYMFAIQAEYDDLKEKLAPSDPPSFSSWVFQGHPESGTYYNKMGPVAWSFIFVALLIPIIFIQGFGEQYLQTWHYFALKNDLELVNRTAGRSGRVTKYGPALDVIRTGEGFQAACLIVGTVAAAFLAITFVDALLNLLAVHFVAECDENAMRNVLINKYTLRLSNRVRVRLPEDELTQKEYEDLWQLV